MSTWVDGRRRRTLDVRDRGLNYGDGLFETLRVRAGSVRLLPWHLERLYDGCARLGIAPPARRTLERELAAAAARLDEGVLKLIVTRGVGPRGYRPSGRELACRILSAHPLPPAAPAAVAGVAVRLCATPLTVQPRLAGLKTLNRLDSVLARSEWTDPRIYEGLMADPDGNLTCATMSNVFVRHGSFLLTPILDRGGVAGVMRRWVLGEAAGFGVRVMEGRLRAADLDGAAEMFLTNAVVGVLPVARVQLGRRSLRPPERALALRLRERLERL